MSIIKATMVGLLMTAVSTAVGFTVAAAPVKVPAKIPTINRLSLYEKSFALPKTVAKYTNPFDTSQIAVDAEFLGPNNNRTTVPCFWNGDSWQMRFSSSSPGLWSWKIKVTSPTGTKEINNISGTVEVADKLPKGPMNTGFVELSPNNRYFQTTSGQMYIPIGSNVSWGNLPDFDFWFKDMSTAGANWARVWMSYMGGFGLEGPESDGYPGLNQIHLDNAAAVDHVVSLAESTGVRVMLTVGNYRELIESDSWGTAGWAKNPYNADNGGPLSKASEMWTNATAIRIYKDKLRYIVARWGYSPAVFAWEFWNETEAPTPWVKEMSEYLKSIDPYKHLVSTTYGTDAIWALPSIDFTMTHIYRQGEVSDMTPVYTADAKDALKYNKPHLLAEFGLDWRASDAQYDPTGAGTNFRKGLWSSFMAGSAGSGMLWWWDNYIAPMNVYHVFTPFARFIRGLSLKEATKQADVTVSSTSDNLYDLALTPDGGWGAYARREFVISTDRTPDTTGLPGHVYSPGKAPWNKPIILKVNNKQDTSFIVGIGNVSSDTKLEVMVDGKVVWSKLFAPRGGKGEWETSEYKSEWKIWQANWNKDYTIPIPKGEHTISLSAPSGDWLTISHLTLKSYSKMPPVVSAGISGDSFTTFWLHDKADIWKAHSEGHGITPTTGLRVEVNGLADGTYDVVWWDTTKGVVVPGFDGANHTIASNGTTTINVPTFNGDIACKLIKR